MMITSGDRSMLDYARDKLRRDPALPRERYNGRTMLHSASAAGDPTTVKLLLRLDADPSITDAATTGLSIVSATSAGWKAPNMSRILVQAGAAMKTVLRSDCL